MLTEQERALFIAQARSMVGRRFGHRQRGERVDCIGLVVLALRAVGWHAHDRDDYGRNPVRDGLREACVDHFGQPVRDMRAGDVALFAWGNPQPNHVGILFDHPAGGLAVVHALAQRRRVIEHRLDEATAGRIIEVFRQ